VRILTDETVARSTVVALREAGNDVLDVHEAGLAGSDDLAIAARAVSEDRIVVTHDKDFADLLRFQIAPHKGSIVLRLRDPSPTATTAVLRMFLSGVPEGYVEGKIIILSESGFRARIIKAADA
jgi:predicted nuclease of predicted toxin-antitoxin system